MTTTFGASGIARTGCGHAGLDSSAVLPITPENALPGLYSLNAIGLLLHSRGRPRCHGTPDQAVCPHPARAGFGRPPASRGPPGRAELPGIHAMSPFEG